MQDELNLSPAALGDEPVLEVEGLFNLSFFDGPSIGMADRSGISTSTLGYGQYAVVTRQNDGSLNLKIFNGPDRVKFLKGG